MFVFLQFLDLQSSLVSHIEQLEHELPNASQNAQQPEHPSITNIPQILPASQPAPRFQIERSLRDPASGMQGGGVVAVLQGGNVFEKAGCNTSVIHGKMPFERLTHMRADHSQLHGLLNALSNEQRSDGIPFTVAGISLVFHPHNPHQPTVHANYRLFELHVPNAAGGDAPAHDIAWFGGGADLTPTYIEKTGENSIYGTHFHQTHKTAIEDIFDQMKSSSSPQGASSPALEWLTRAPNDPQRHDTFYDYTKRWCDQYFFLPHRGETRGLGGIFFDDLSPETTNLTYDQLFSIVTRMGDTFAQAYFPLVVQHAHSQFSPEEKQFQQLRRGRYVEFNVMYDRGTKFGLAMPSSAHIRTEQILMSLPLTARYEYCHTPEKGSAEENTLEILRTPVDWANNIA